VKTKTTHNAQGDAAPVLSIVGQSLLSLSWLHCA